MRFVLPVGVAVVGLGFVGLGCEPSLPRYHEIPQCEGNTCSMIVGSTLAGGGGNGSGGNSSGAGGDVQMDVTGTVEKDTNTGFLPITGTQYNAQAVIQSISALGQMVSTTYGTGNNPTQFDLSNVPTGPTWFLVEDQLGTSGVYNTLSFGTVPALASLTLPVVDKTTFDGIASTVGLAGGVSTTAAQVVLVLNNGTTAAQGIAVSGGDGGGTIVYDDGVGNYVVAATSTGSAGTAIIFNAALNGQATITLTNTTTNHTNQVTVWTGPGAVSILSALAP
jgi:hypothetical protein